MTNYLITGGAGFIGSHLADALLRDPTNRVTVIDDLSTGSAANLAPHPNLNFITADILVMPDIERYIAESDVIYHLAAAVGVELVVHDPVQTIKTNIDGSLRVLELAAQYKKRIFLASTSEVYGRSAKAKFSEEDDLLIGTPTHSRWAYACSKLLDEFLLMAYAQKQELPGTVVRFFNTVGPRQTGRFGMVLPRFVAAALAEEPLQVYGSGGQTRCFCHVADVVRALVGLLDKPESIGGIYNIGSSESVTMLELAERVRAVLGSASKIELIPYEKAYAKGFDDMMHRSPDTSKLQELLGWKPEHTLDDIISDIAASLS